MGNRERTPPPRPLTPSGGTLGGSLLPNLFVKVYFEKAGGFPNNAEHFRHYSLAYLAAEIVYSLLRGNKQPWSVNRICLPGEGKITTWGGPRVWTPFLPPQRGARSQSSPFQRPSPTRQRASRESRSLFSSLTLRYPEPSWASCRFTEKLWGWGGWRCEGPCLFVGPHPPGSPAPSSPCRSLEGHGENLLSGLYQLTLIPT